MIEISSRKQIRDYFDREAVSQSLLKDLSIGLHPFLDRKKKESDDLVLGSLIDAMLLGKPSELKKEFFILEEEISVSETEKEIVKIYVDRNKTKIKTSYQEDLLLDILDEKNWQKNWKLETRLKKFIEKTINYLKVYYQSLEKVLISKKQYDTAKIVVESLKTNVLTSRYFDVEEINKNKEIEVFYQKPLFFKLKGQECKMLLDILIKYTGIDGKIVYIPIDLKTTGFYVSQFATVAKKLRYDIQAAFYTDGLYRVYPDAKIAPFTFIVESTIHPGNPGVLKVTDNFLHHGRKGGDVEIFEQNNHRLKGYQTLLEEYIYYKIKGFEKDALFADTRPALLDWNSMYPMKKENTV